MEEQLISFKCAKLAKEKGFNIECFAYYYNNKLKFISEENPGNCNEWDDSCTAPNQSLLQKWLREKKNQIINISYFPEAKGDYKYNVLTRRGAGWIGTGKYKTYEEALEEGLLDALKLI